MCTVLIIINFPGNSFEGQTEQSLLPTFLFVSIFYVLATSESCPPPPSSPLLQLQRYRGRTGHSANVLAFCLGEKQCCIHENFLFFLRESPQCY